MDAEDKAVGIMTDTVAEMTCSQCACQIDVAGLKPFVKVECPDCGSTETVPARLGQFLLLDLIGAGGMGGVYYAKDETLGRFVAIKVMLKSLGENKEFIETFKREAQAVAKLNHPNIVQIYSFGQEKGQTYIVMELVPGESFSKMVEKGESLSQALVMRIGLDVAKALSAADEIGLMHGDIKPENILLDEKMQAKLVDFGLATFAHQAEPEGIWGTPYYIAPEKIKREKVDARSDIYSLGATLYHALTGHPPFEGDTPVDVVKARLKRDPKELHELRPNIENNVERIVMRMLEHLPAKRHPTYASLVSDLTKVANELGDDPRKFQKKGKPVLKKKRSSPIPGEAVLPGAKPKIAITKKSPSVVSDVLSEYKKATTGAVVSKQKRSLAGLWVVLVMILVMAGAGGGLYLKNKKNKEIQARKEAIELATQIKTAKEIYGNIELAATNVLIMAATAEAFVNDTEKAVSIILGEEPGEPEPKAKDPMPARESKPRVSRRDAFGREAPAGIAPLKQLKGETVPPPPTDVPSAEPAEQAVEPEIKVLARKVISEVKKISEKAKAVKIIQSAALLTRNEAVNARTSSAAAAKVSDLLEDRMSAQNIEKEAKEAFRNAETAMRKVQAIKIKIEEEQEAKIREEEELARLKAEEEARLREEEKHKALIEKELNMTKEARKDSLPLIKQYQYQEIVGSLTAQLSKYQTDEGKTSMKILIDRYSHLHGLKMFIIERLNADPFDWGWGKGNRARSVIGADESNVKLKGKSVPWTEVSTSQMLKFINHYLSSRKVSIRALGEQNFSAAVFCFENGGDETRSIYSKKAHEAAVNFAHKAIELCPDLEGEVKRLLPLE